MLVLRLRFPPAMLELTTTPKKNTYGTRVMGLDLIHDIDTWR